jgi:hypothetical protein
MLKETKALQFSKLYSHHINEKLLDRNGTWNGTYYFVVYDSYKLPNGILHGKRYTSSYKRKIMFEDFEEKTDEISEVYIWGVLISPILRIN